MFFLTIQKRGLDGIGESAGVFYNLILWSAVSNPGGTQIDMGQYSSAASAKTFAGTVFQHSFSAWSDLTLPSPVFTT